MQITTTTRAELLEVTLKGRMDAGWSDHVAMALEQCLQSGQHAICVDMAQVDYISSAGIRILVLYAKKLKLIQGSFSVVNASSQVRRILELSGLESLLLVPGEGGASKGVRTPTTSIVLAEPGATAESFDLDPQAALRLHWPGNPEPWLAGVSAYETCVTVEFPADAMGIGLGGFGDGQSGEALCPGEFLAAAGAAVCLPADGSNKPDYMLQEAALTPSLRVAYGVIGFGGFRQLLRFDKGPQQTSLPVSTVVKACLEANGGNPVGLVMVAETASLTGACLQRVPSAGQTAGGPPAPGTDRNVRAPASLFTFPAVRDRLSFTAEPAFPNTTSLVVGFAAWKGREDGLRLLKPAVPSGEIQCHFHAAAFPYQPLRKGKVDLQETTRPLFESGQVLGLLHLINDWRDLHGAGESRFLRGACWWSALHGASVSYS